MAMPKDQVQKEIVVEARRTFVDAMEQSLVSL